MLGLLEVRVAVLFFLDFKHGIIWDKVFNSGQSKFCGRQPLKNILSGLLNTLSYFWGCSFTFH